MQWLTGSSGVWLLLALALYGLACALTEAQQLLRRMLRRENAASLTLLVLMQNQAQEAEGVVRALLDLVGRSPLSDGEFDLLLVDLGSTDETPAILERLAQKAEHIRTVQLPSDQPANIYEIARSLCHTDLVILADLRGRTAHPSVLHTLQRIWE